MLFYEFKNYQEFQELFGIVEHGNGVKSRKNKILLALYKDREQLRKHIDCKSMEAAIDSMNESRQRYSRCLDKDSKNTARWRYIKRVYYGRYCRLTEKATIDLLGCTSLALLKHKLFSVLGDRSLSCGHYELYLNGRSFYSDQYRTDSNEGLCMDGTLNAIRYVNVEKDKAFKMKAGKLFNHILECNSVTAALPEQIKRWLSEEFVAAWIEYARENIGEQQYELHIDDNFSDIYDPHCCAGYREDGNSFGSCMVGDDQWTFYRDAVDAKAAYLTDADGMIVARCIIFTDVQDEDGNTWRLAERQYSAFRKPELQRQLISALIRGGHIDGYKAVGASCGAAREFLDNDGNSLENKCFSIRCNLEDGDTLSYQDSFKWYDYDAGRADNHGYGELDLAVTDSTFSNNNHDDDTWSDYNSEWIPNDESYYVNTRDDVFWSYQVVEAHIDGQRYTEFCFRDDCIEIDDEFYYAGYNAESPGEYGIYECPVCGSYYVEDNGYYSELTGDDYCCDDCMAEAEKRWYEDNGYTWSDYDDEWVEGEVVLAMVWRNYSFGYRGFYETSISEETLHEMVDDGEATYYNGKYYIDKVGFDGEPVHLLAITAA